MLGMIWDHNWDEVFFQKLIQFENSENHAIGRITFFRDASGSYMPDADKMDFVLNFREVHNESGFFLSDSLEPQKLDNHLNQIPVVKAGISSFKKYVSPYSFIKSTSAMMYVLASLEKRDSGFDEMILFNHYGNICEGISSNILINHNSEWLTPCEESGAVAGTYLEFLKSFIPIRSATISADILFSSDRIFLINSVHGFRKLEIHRNL